MKRGQLQRPAGEHLVAPSTYSDGQVFECCRCPLAPSREQQLGRKTPEKFLFCCQERSTTAELPRQLIQLYPGENKIAFFQCCESDVPFLDEPMDFITWARICHQPKQCGTGHSSPTLRTVSIASGSQLHRTGVSKWWQKVVHSCVICPVFHTLLARPFKSFSAPFQCADKEVVGHFSVSSYPVYPNKSHWWQFPKINNLSVVLGARKKSQVYTLITSSLQELCLGLLLSQTSKFR